MPIDILHTDSHIEGNIKVIGVGGAGGNAVNTMIEKHISNVVFIVANTDEKELAKSKSDIKINLGEKTTGGLGAGSNPKIGFEAAKESDQLIRSKLENTDMLFIIAGLGGGTGTGAAPFIASIAKELSIITVGVVTMPFNDEGNNRKLNAIEGLEKLKESVDTLMIMPNQKIMEIYPNLSAEQAFRRADNVFVDAVNAVCETIDRTGFINVDFADIKEIIKDKGYAIMCNGRGEGKEKAKEAAVRSVSNPLLMGINLKDCKSLMINVIGGKDMKMDEFALVSEMVISEIGEKKKIIKGLVIDEKMNNKIKAIIIATGLRLVDTFFEDLSKESEVDTKEEEALPTLLNRIKNTEFQEKKKRRVNDRFPSFLEKSNSESSS